MRTLIHITAAAAILSGCAVGQKISYEQPVSLQMTGGGAVDVAVHDVRPYVVTGDKEATFVGLQRGGYGNPFDVTTASGKPLATVIAGAMATSLEDSGFDVNIVAAAPGDSAETVISRLTDGAGVKDLLLILRELKSDTMNNAAFLYDLELRVYEDGALAGKAARQGKDDLGGSLLNPAGHAREAVPAAWADMLAGLLNDPAIAGALKN